MRISSRRSDKRSQLTLEDELRLTRDVEDASARMARAIVRSDRALRELARAREPRATRERGVTIASDEEREKLAVEIASLRLTSDVLDRAAEAMEPETDARSAYVAARRSFRRATAEWTAASAPLVIAIARRYRRPGVETIDLVQDGSIGLIRAIEKFDPARGYRFHTYAAWWIRQHIFRALADHGRSIRVPLPMVEASHRVAKARRVFEGIHGREPGDEELAVVSGLARATVAAVDAIIDEPISLQGRVGDQDTDILDRLADRSAPPPDEQVALSRLNDSVRGLFDALMPCEREVLALRFGLAGNREHTLVEAASSLGLSRERARRLEERALSKLRARSARARLGGHLAA